MRVLLLRPVPHNDRFGLGPFFRTEPLGLAYLAAALERRGHDVTLVDLRFGRSLDWWLRTTRPRVVGVACMHALEIDDVLAVARRIKALAPDAFVLVGGHSASAYPFPLQQPEIDALVLGDGEYVVPDVVEAIEKGRPIADVPGLLAQLERGQFVRTAPVDMVDLDCVPLPARHHLDRARSRYSCLTFRPAWLVETARGCPYRCSFCSVSSLYGRSYRERSIDAVCRDFETVGPHVFVADDLFWHHPDRSFALARELARRAVRKRWLLVQTRSDTVESRPDLLEAWRPIAEHFDLFLGLEAPTDNGLSSVVKDTTISRTIDGVRAARQAGYGVTGNFLVDPDWNEEDFERLWAFVDEHRLFRAGYTILTPLPGTTFFDEARPRIRAAAWSQFDMHHLLWEPQLGAERFFELYCRTWRRSVLNLKGQKRWWRWAREVSPFDLPLLMRVLLRTQDMMKPARYMADHRLVEPGAGCVDRVAPAAALTILA
jgi:radical SAM superfamily enzyme YgiQ (UPF0313 family)